MTLGDFKSLIDSPGQYRYYFKALHPEFGTIREEVGSGNQNGSSLLSVVTLFGQVA